MKLLIYITSILSFSILFGAPPTTFPSNQSGDWTSDAIWDGTPGGNDCSPSGNDTYRIKNGHTVTMSCVGTVNFTGNVNIIIEDGGHFIIDTDGSVSRNIDLTIEEGGEMTVNGDLALNGSSVTDVDGTSTVTGSITGSGGGGFDCDGTNGTGTVNIGLSSCTVCTNAADAGCNDNTLPIDLLFSNVECDNAIHKFNWATATEENNDYFSIESSIDGVNFVEISKIDGAGNSLQELNYTHSFSGFKNGPYYRLSQTDYDNTTEKFEIHYCESNTSNSLYISTTNSEKKTYEIMNLPTETNFLNYRFTNDVGQVVSRGDTKKVDLSKSNSGNYIVEIIFDSERQFHRLNVQ